MKTLVAVAMAGTLWGGMAEMKRITVRVEDSLVMPLPQRAVAIEITSKIFRGIGIGLDWKVSGRVNADIVVELRTNTPAHLLPGALAYALPYEGTHIVVFYDRIQGKSEPWRALGHVMAHEIGHILQGINRHAENGIMKAAWSPSDFEDMRVHPLEFAAHDVELIHRGLDVRAARVATK